MRQSFVGVLQETAKLGVLREQSGVLMAPNGQPGEPAKQHRCDPPEIISGSFRESPGKASLSLSMLHTCFITPECDGMQEFDPGAE